MDTFSDLEALAQADLVRRREVKPIDLVDAAIARIERVNPKLNAVVTSMFDLAREAANAPLAAGAFAGVPFLLKDLFTHYAGVRLTCGAKLLENYVSDHDSELVRRYKRDA